MVNIIDELQKLQQSNTIFIIQRKAADVNSSDAATWRDLHHVCGRLVSYRHATQILFIAREYWPELFRDFRVTCVPPSRPGPNPLPSDNPLKAGEIVGRFPLADKKQDYRRLAEEAGKKYHVDEKIADQYKSKQFRPFVHAEPQLLNWLENDGGGTAPSRFFSAWAYIGCSKPACRLCSYYFDAHPSTVATRRTHGNVYRSWRMPDRPDFGGQLGDAPRADRLTMITNIRERVCAEVLRVIDEKVTNVKTNDSNTISSIMQTEPGGVPLVLWRGRTDPRSSGAANGPRDDESVDISELDDGAGNTVVQDEDEDEYGGSE
jgi:hypothetical protein